MEVHDPNDTLVKELWYVLQSEYICGLVLYLFYWFIYSLIDCLVNLFTGNRGKRSRSNRASRKGGCKHQLIDVCLLPQCNCACPKYINRLTGDEMNFFKLFIQYGIDKADLAELLSVDISTMNSMSYDTISDRVLKVIRQRS